MWVVTSRESLMMRERSQARRFAAVQGKVG
jgi:hypothetical protein